MSKREVSRREFLKGTAAGAATLAVTGILGACTSAGEPAATSEAGTTAAPETTPAPDNAPQPQQTYTYADTIVWDAEYDVVVLGIGASGCVAAKTAADEGAGVLIVEKMSEAHSGGNSKVCGQLFAYGYNDPENALTYYKALAGGRQVPEAMLKTIADGVAGMADTLAGEFGFDSKEFLDWTPIAPINNMSPEYPELPGSEKIGLWTTHQGISDGYLYTSLKQRVLDRKDRIDIWYESPAQELIQDPQSKAVIGVKVARGGSVRNVRALNGVVVCTGGFEDDAEMVQHYLNLIDYAPIGGLYNTGDGIKMCQKLGADLWHMTAYEGGFGLGGTSFYVNEGENASQIQVLTQGPLNTGSCILVGTDGDRFLNESEVVRHGHLYDNGLWVNPHFPEKMFLMFDQTQYELIEAESAIPERFKGDVKAFDTIEEAAGAIGCSGEQLAGTIEDYNSFAKNGKDYACGRKPEFMRAFDGAKYYIIQLKCEILNTQGGPKRNENAEILDTAGNPIPHLYSAGEMGGITCEMYQGGTNIAECIIFGQIAGRSAAAPKEALPTYEHAVPVESSPKKLGDETDAGQEKVQDYQLGEHEYVGTGTGMNGSVTVKVTMDGDAIGSVEVLEHSETDGIGTLAIDGMTEKFKGLSTAEEIDGVDTVSSATITSKALQEAVKDALSQIK
ncbi:MAG: FAD-dependent oxidoreductase [Hungatella sp.]|nr:FAD-dependent oxidoreductase [Hungatella sp.]